MRALILFPMLAGLGLVFGTPLTSAATLVSNLPSPQSAGTTITFTIDGEGESSALYRLSVGPAWDPGRIGVVYDYSQDNVLEWTIIDPGTYRVIGTVLDTETGRESVASQVFTIMPAVPPSVTSPVVQPTGNPLVALYVVPPCPEPVLMRVRFFAPSVGIEQTTSPKRCEPGTPLHFYVAGMRENTTYRMRHETLGPNGLMLDPGPFIRFTTGQAPIGISPNRLTLPQAPWASVAEPVIWNSPLIGNQDLGLSPYIHATDLDGHLIWYLDEVTWAVRPSHDGTFWSLRPDPFTGIQDNLLVKVDLLGQVVKQTSVQSLNHQVAQLGHGDRINDIHHDVRDLPNGDIAFISTVERLVTDVQGAGEVSVIGDMILVTNQDFEIKWIWNGWDHLDPTRLATLGEVCMAGVAGCQPFFLADETNDWMHANALAYTPDGHLILSVRHQDWIIKINYANGAGDGRILWRLGREGDFRLVGGHEDDWFSHTHDPSFISDNRILVYDNSNQRCASATPPADCQSRGQVWEIDEGAMTAELVFNKDLGEYAFAVGSAQPLGNGNYWFNSGMLGTFAEPRTTMQEVDPSRATLYQNDLDIFQYRSYRLSDLYTPPPSWGTPTRMDHGRSDGCPRSPDHSCRPIAVDPETPRGPDRRFPR
ncbi:aryl-sulfate sulfotransferase [Thiocystis violacea]|uniref:aryl-sulfate sulfotransferase n=1 Tax=Thiocystis violacea TaxID=13725 RepID=UPI0019066A22|nr:aryl-sulfate sulfotransferase [Thiocystis violacea]MBK1719364.1 hypothetical protein [Thiocystis violacea]